MSQYFLWPLVFLSTISWAVCIPTNEFHTIFLGMSADGRSYATGTSERVLLWKDEKPGAALFKNRICRFSIENNLQQGECLEVPSHTDNVQEAKALLQKEFNKTHKDWSLSRASALQKRKFLATLDCEAAFKESPQCKFELRKPRDSRYLDLVWTRSVPLRATPEVSPLMHTSQEIYFSKDKKNICVRFERIAHASANCGSREDIVVCGPSSFLAPQ